MYISVKRIVNEVLGKGVCYKPSVVNELGSLIFYVLHLTPLTHYRIPHALVFPPTPYFCSHRLFFHPPLTL